jgi:nitrile hydratase
VNGAHDLGGMHGFGPVVPEPDEPVFHSEWERRVFALNLAMGAWQRWNLDMFRSAGEQMPPGDYLTTSYYEHWLYGLERVLEQSGLLQPDELARVREAPASVLAPAPPVRLEDGALRVADVEVLLHQRRRARRDDPVAPPFQTGQPVRARNLHPVGHTRLPRYVRGRRGVIDRDHGVFVFPDSHAAGQGSRPQHVYSVRFEARELWGPDASASDRVYVDLWDDYLEPS